MIGASEHTCHSIDDVVSLLKKGSNVRHTGATQMNDESSRSHAIFTLYIGMNRIPFKWILKNRCFFFFSEQRLRDTNSNSHNAQASFDALVKPVQSTFDGKNLNEIEDIIGFFCLDRKLSICKTSFCRFGWFRTCCTYTKYRRTFSRINTYQFGFIGSG